MKKPLLFVFAGTMLLASCAKEESQNVNQDSIYSIYELSYNKDLDKTTAQATFRFGGATGTLLDLNAPAVSEFNGDELLYNSILGTHKKEYAGLTNGGTFTYSDLDNNSFANTTPTMDVIDFPTTIDTISMSGAYTFIWSGNAVAPNETISLTIDGTQQGNFEVFSTIINGNTQLILDANKLQNLGIGNATCTLRRGWNKLTLDQATSKGGRMNVSYTTSQNIYIKP